MGDMSTIISNLGFPIAACTAMGWFCFYLTTSFKSTIDSLQVSINSMSKSIEMLSDTITDHNEKYKEV